MARTIVERYADQEREYVFLGNSSVTEVTVSSGRYEWIVDLNAGTATMNAFPTEITSDAAEEIIFALRDIMPLLKPANVLAK